MVKPTSPYNFVPLQRPQLEAIHVPDHGKPHPDGLCGEIEVKWEFKTPFLIGEQLQKETGPHSFTQNAAGFPIIQGATLRGAIRNIVEIITDSKMSLVDRKAHFAVRDLTDKKNWQPYNHIKPNREMSYGFLVWADEKKKIDFSCYEGWDLVIRNGYEFLTNELFLSETLDVEFEILHLKEKYEIANCYAHYETKEIDVKITKKDGSNFKIKKTIASVATRSTRQNGWLVFGDKDPSFEEQSTLNPKKYSTIISDNQNLKKITNLNQFVVKRLFKTHYPISKGNHSLLEFWMGAYKNRLNKEIDNKLPLWPINLAGKKMPGIPVFIGHLGGEFNFPDDNTLPEDFYLSLSRFVKIPYRNSVGDIIARDEKGIDEKALDFAQSLFGRIIEKGNEEYDTLKGRVFFSDALCVKRMKDLRTVRANGSANSPRASFFPYYLAPKDENGTEHPYDYSNDGSRVSGWKRYAARKGTVNFPPPLGKNDVEMDFIYAAEDNPVIFNSIIKFHNITMKELAALKWALTYNDEPNTVHLLGRGKPQGFGKCHATVKIKAKRNDGEVFDEAHLPPLEINETTKTQLLALATPSDREDLHYPIGIVKPSNTPNPEHKPKKFVPVLEDDKETIKQDKNKEASEAILNGYVAIKKDAKVRKTLGRILPLHKQNL